MAGLQEVPPWIRNIQKKKMHRKTNSNMDSLDGLEFGEM